MLKSCAGRSITAAVLLLLVVIVAMQLIPPTPPSAALLTPSALVSRVTPYQRPTLSSLDMAGPPVEVSAEIDSEQPGSGGGGQASPTATPYVVSVTVASANIRQGPGTNYPVVGNARRNDELTVVGAEADGQWLRVRANGGISGCVAANLLSTPEPPLGQSTTFPTSVGPLTWTEEYLEKCSVAFRRPAEWAIREAQREGIRFGVGPDTAAVSATISCLVVPPRLNSEASARAFAEELSDENLRFFLDAYAPMAGLQYPAILAHVSGTSRDTGLSIEAANAEIALPSGEYAAIFASGSPALWSDWRTTFDTVAKTIH